MKLLSFRWKDRDRIGFALDDERVVDLGEIAQALGREPYADMLALIEAGDAGTRFLRDAQAFAKDQPGKLDADPGERDRLSSAGAAPLQNLRRCAEQFRQQRAQDFRARSSAVLSEAGVVAGRP